MRILLFAQQLAAFRSGVGTYAWGLAAGLSARGHRVTAVVPRGQEAKIPGVEIVAVPPPPRWDPTPGGWIGLGRSFAAVLRERGAGYDVAHFTDAREGWSAAGTSPIPLSGMANDSYALDWLAAGYPRALFADRHTRSLYYRLLRAVEGRTYRRLGVLTANSRHVAAAVERGYRLPAVPVVWYGLPDDPPAPAVALPGTPSILFVGGNFQRKGLGTLLAAAALLRPRFPAIHIHVAGRDRNQPALARQAASLGLSENVTFHGWQPNDRVRGMMAGATLFALPSFTEGFGFVYLEAMRAGTPVIATSAGGAGEAFTEGEEALFCAPGDEQALAAAVARIAGDPALAGRLRDGGRRAVARFSLGAQALAMETLFSSLPPRDP